VLTWDMDMVDIDLVVEDPSGEACTSFNNHTRSGGMTTKDMTGGYGPIVFQQRVAIRGTYKVFARLVSSKGRTAVRGVTVMLRVYSQYGTAKHQEALHMNRLKDDKEMRLLAEIVAA